MASFSFSFRSASPTPVLFILLLLPFLLISSSEARDFQVGGTDLSWTLPLPSPDSLNRWAQSQRFRIHDTLSWKYDARTESVLEVKEEDYKSCNISKPIVEYNDGDTKVPLNRSGPFYFISGAEGHCQKGLKLAVVVMSNRHSDGTHQSPAAAPSAPPPQKGGAASSGTGLLGLMIVTGMGVWSVMTTIVTI